MSLTEIIKEIDKLSETERTAVLNHMKEKNIAGRRAYAISFLNKISGSGKGVWDMDAQEYVNQLRSDDRV